MGGVMYDDSCYYDNTHDPNSITGGVGSGSGVGGGVSFPSHHHQIVSNCSGLSPLLGGTTCSNNSLEDNIRLSSFSLEELSNQQNHSNEAAAVAAATMDFEFEHELNTRLMQDVLHDSNNLEQQHINWDSKVQDMHDMSSQQAQQYHHLNIDPGQPIDLPYNLQSFNLTPFSNSSSYAQTPTPDLLNLFHLPRCSVSSMPPNSSICFTNPAGKKNKQSNFPSSLDFFGDHPTADGATSASNALYDPPLHLNLPPQQTPIFKELFHSLPHNYGLPSSRGTGGSFFGGMDERDQGLSGLYQDGDGRQFIETTSTLDFSRDMSGLGKGGEGKGGNKQPFATERQRREQLNGKYQALKNLVPSPTKSDRASIVHDAIDYIKELLRTVEELKILVDKKRYGTERSKKRKTEDEATGDMESSSMKPHSFLTEREQSNGPSRATWIQRKSKEAEVDVRIVEDEITIKLIQRKKINCLLSVSKILDELQLDLLHVSGGNIGDFYSFLFNTKIYEGSSVHGIAIANKLIETVDKNYAAFQPSNF